MTTDWRKSIEVTFPIIRYHPPIEYRDGVKIRKTRTLLNAPMTPWGSADGSEYLRHGGTGLSRSAEYPSKETLLPGGILDANGHHIKILDIDAPEDKPGRVFEFFLNLFGLFRTYRYRYSFGKPEQLTLDEFKNKLIMLGKEEKKMPRPVKKILSAKSFYEVMEAECERDIVNSYYKTVWVKNWLEEPRRYARAIR